jgi:hypothetical protein
MKRTVGTPRRLSSLGLLAALLALTVSGSALAEPSPGEKAAAEALFQKGVELMAVGKTAEACEKFDGSNQLDPALGTMLRLADCYERAGKTASAWALFQQAAATASSQGQLERNKIATERANSLQQRLSRLQLAVDTRSSKEGLQVKLNGKSIPQASWDAALPVDPGSQTIEVSAPGYITWKSSVEVAAGQSTANLEVPALKPEPQESSTTKAAPVSVAPEPSSSGSTQKTAGFVIGGVGLAGLAVGGVFAFLAYDKNQQSMDQCRKGDATACTPEGVQLRKDAQSSGTIATAAMIAGGALVATGITLLISAPSRKEAAASTLQPKTAAYLYPGGVLVRGEF